MITHGMPYQPCPRCGKFVKLAGWFAGWHVCVSDDERRAREIYRANMAMPYPMSQQGPFNQVPSPPIEPTHE